MSLVDLAILAIILLSAVLGLLRGFIREMLSLFVWLLAIFVTLGFSSRFASLIPATVASTPGVRLLIAAVVLFLGTLLIGLLCAWLMRSLLLGRMLSWPDKALGALFGALRGVVLIALLVLLANLQPELRLQPFWQSSRLLPQFQKLAGEMHERLPAQLAPYFSF